jgi:hypothetical protein
MIFRRYFSQRWNDGKAELLRTPGACQQQVFR